MMDNVIMPIAYVVFGLVGIVCIYVWIQDNASDFFSTIGFGILFFAACYYLDGYIQWILIGGIILAFINIFRGRGGDDIGNLDIDPD